MCANTNTQNTLDYVIACADVARRLTNDKLIEKLYVRQSDISMGYRLIFESVVDPPLLDRLMFPERHNRDISQALRYRWHYEISRVYALEYEQDQFIQMLCMIMEKYLRQLKDEMRACGQEIEPRHYRRL